MKELLHRQNSRTFLAKFLSALLLGVSAGICLRPLVDETGIDYNSGGEAQHVRKWLQ
jgi:hypothetical protein